MKKILRYTAGSTFLLLGITAAVFLLTSAYRLLFDEGLRTAGPNKTTFALHRSLSKRIPDYAHERIASGKAKSLTVAQISATEWPVYGSFFYLLATENLQQQWETDPSFASTAPAASGAEAIEASLQLMLDKNHAKWVIDYWGPDYLSDPNCFYRMLMIGSITAHHRLTGQTEHLEMLKTLVDDLAADIDASPSGLVDDYPHQCFPADVGVAIAVILRADASLGTDRSEWAKAALTKAMSHHEGELPPYMALSENGRATSNSRGCTNGFLLSFSHTVDPDLSDTLYQKLLEHFWQEGEWCAGWREFAHGRDPHGAAGIYEDPDSGPVIANYGTSATGLGLGAARLHGDSNRAGLLAAELITTCLPLPTGRLLLPSLVADQEHAPLFPEIVLLHQLSLTHHSPDPRTAAMPQIVWLILGIELLFVILSVWIALSLFRAKLPKTSQTLP